MSRPFRMLLQLMEVRWTDRDMFHLHTFRRPASRLSEKAKLRNFVKMADEDALMAMKLHQELNPHTRRVSRRSADNPNKRQALQALNRKAQGAQGAATVTSTASDNQTQNNSGLDSSLGGKDRSELPRRTSSALWQSKPQQSEAGSDAPRKQTGSPSRSKAAPLWFLQLLVTWKTGVTPQLHCMHILPWVNCSHIAF